MKKQETEGAPEIDADLESQLSELDKIDGDYVPTTEDVATARKEVEGPSASSVELCAALISVSFTVVAGRRGDHWKLSDDESAMLGQAVGAVLDKYAPSFESGPEAALILTGLVIIGPRVMADMKASQALEEDQGAAGDGGKSKA